MERLRQKFPQELIQAKDAVVLSELQLAKINQRDSNLFRLPPEILKDVLVELNAFSMLNFMKTSKLSYYMGNDNNLWKKMHERWIERKQAPLNVIIKISDVTNVSPLDNTVMAILDKERKGWRIYLSFWEMQLHFFLSCNLKCVKAMYDFDYVTNYELSFVKGDEIIVLYDSPDWWFGWKLPQTLDSTSFEMKQIKIGYFPAEYVSRPICMISIKSIFDCKPVRIDWSDTSDTSSVFKRVSNFLWGK